MARPHLAALGDHAGRRGLVGPVSVRSGIDGRVVNANVAEYAAAGQPAPAHASPAGSARRRCCWSRSRPPRAQIRIAHAARTTVTGARTGRTAAGVDVGDGAVRPLTRRRRCADGAAGRRSTRPSRSSPRATRRSPRRAIGALDELAERPGGFAGLLATRTRRRGQRLWERFGVELDAETRQTQLVLNLHVFHLLQTLSPHTADLDAGVPARGLHGEGYRGHVFWDELFVLPVLDAPRSRPSPGRCSTTGGAASTPPAHAARAAGLPGRMFPWQSGSDGREETPSELFNPRSGRWMPDNSRRQRHVGLAVAYNAWQHYQATGDVDWLADRGAELIIEVARLFAGLATYDPADDRYHIDGVMGPDEYHDGYPDAPGPGLRDNAYTNVLAAWVCRAGRRRRSRCSPATTATSSRDRLGIDRREPAHWDAAEPPAARCRSTPTESSASSTATRTLAEFDWDRYRATYGNIGRLDLILEAEGDTTNRYKLAKQADVLMLVYLLGPDELLAHARPARLPVAPDDWSAHGRLLPGPHRARLDAQPGRARLGARPAGPGPGVGSCSATRSTPTSTTPRAAPPARASTSARWPAPSTSSPGPSPACPLRRPAELRPPPSRAGCTARLRAPPPRTAPRRRPSTTTGSGSPQRPTAPRIQSRCLSTIVECSFLAAQQWTSSCEQLLRSSIDGAGADACPRRERRFLDAQAADRRRPRRRPHWARRRPVGRRGLHRRPPPLPRRRAVRSTR